MKGLLTFLKNVEPQIFNINHHFSTEYRSLCESNLLQNKETHFLYIGLCIYKQYPYKNSHVCERGKESSKLRSFALCRFQHLSIIFSRTHL